ncbi:MAG: hypothetical protein ABIA75_03915 [Candidatus Neomarinimicrobiota bacterium]
MNNLIRVSLVIIGILLVLNGLLNIIDDGRLLTFDITTILAGMGFLLVSAIKNRPAQQ